MLILSMLPFLRAELLNRIIIIDVVGKTYIILFRTRVEISFSLDSWMGR